MCDSMDVEVRYRIHFLFDGLYSVKQTSSFSKLKTILYLMHKGNTWGTCKNGTEGMGCGDQEMFRNCADIQIYSSVVGYPPNAIDIPSAIYLRDSSAPTGRRPLIIK